jgi:indolepyruvate ferredoxin oxidoreductase, beta subunit
MDPAAMDARMTARPYAVVIAALGGEGGGVLGGWLVEAARRSNFWVQATSVPGVAQRTGATSYYIEWAQRQAGQTSAPLFALSPTVGQVDVLISSELLETGRLLERGMVTPSTTTLISSISRAYTVAEKIAMGDGRIDGEKIQRAGRALAKHSTWLDMNALAAEHGTVVSAIMFGALAGCGVLPWSIGVCHEVIGSGRHAKASIAGFNAACQMIAAGSGAQIAGATASPAQAASSDHSLTFDKIVQLGRERLTDYQDAQYAALYERRLRDLFHGDTQSERAPGLAAEVARRLALWMAYEDVARVADLKSRASRFESIRREAGAGERDLIEVREFLKPGVEEIASVLPASLGRWLMKQKEKRQWPATGPAQRLQSNGLPGVLLLRALAQARRWRRSSLRFAAEQAAIEDWLDCFKTFWGLSIRGPGGISPVPSGVPSEMAPLAMQVCQELVRMPQMRKGYSDTHARGLSNYQRLRTTLLARLLSNPQAIEPTALAALRAALDAALSDPEGRALEKVLGGEGIAPLPAKGKPIFWAKRVSRHT